MSHYIVIPPPSFHLAPASAISGAAAAEGGLESAPFPVIKNLGDLLRHKRSELIAFANAAMASAAGLGMMNNLATATAKSDSRTHGKKGKKPERAAGGEGAPEAFRPSAGDSGVTILEGVGALVMPEEMVDRAALEGGMGATVIENFFVPLENPVPIASGGSPSASMKKWHLQDINVAAAAAQGFRGEGMIVGVLDTGIQPNHPEFQGKTVHFAEFGATGQHLSSVMRDAGSHGTHVSGIIAGKTAGVAPKADLAVAAVLTIPGPRGLGGYFAQILGGINWLITHPFTNDPNDPGVDVMNASLGGGGYNTYYYSTLANARLTSGTLLAAAIGNAGPMANAHGSPGNYDIVVGVGAIDSNRDVASFSDWGTVSQHGGLRKPDLCAPGDPVWSSVPTGYDWMSGTSMASPVVAGALALLLQKHPHLTLNATGLLHELYKLVAPLSGPSNQQRSGRGRLDLSGF